MIIFLAIIYCIPFGVATLLFIDVICAGYFKGINFLLIIWLYILLCLLWPIGVIVALLYGDYEMKNQPLIKKDEKENKRKMVCEVLEELKIR
jgi:hypothetical protein